MHAYIQRNQLIFNILSQERGCYVSSTAAEVCIFTAMSSYSTIQRGGGRGFYLKYLCIYIYIYMFAISSKISCSPLTHALVWRPSPCTRTHPLLPRLQLLRRSLPPMSRMWVHPWSHILAHFFRSLLSFVKLLFYFLKPSRVMDHNISSIWMKNFQCCRNLCADGWSYTHANTHTHTHTHSLSLSPIFFSLLLLLSLSLIYMFAILSCHPAPLLSSFFFVFYYRSITNLEPYDYLLALSDFTPRLWMSVNRMTVDISFHA